MKKAGDPRWKEVRNAERQYYYKLAAADGPKGVRRDTLRNIERDKRIAEEKAKLAAETDRRIKHLAEANKAVERARVIVSSPILPVAPSVGERIIINGNEWVAREGITYKHDYETIFKKVRERNDVEVEKTMYRHLILNDLWFFVYFVLGWPGSNHKFIVDVCREVEDGPTSQTLDIWFREGGKSTIITTARSVQRVLREPNLRVCIFSYARSPALSFLRSIKQLLETSQILKDCFPDVLWGNPEKESPKWSELEGLTVRRKGFFKESTFEAHGLLEGMPTGKHFPLLVFDDIVTADLVQTPDMMEKVKERFDMAMNVGTVDGDHWVIGTNYHHNDPLVYIANKKKSNGEPLYHVRRKPATEQGTFYGRSVFLPENRLELLRSNKYHFLCQQLLDPTPIADRMLSWDMVRVVEKEAIPDGLHKFMIVDAAGSDGRSKGHKGADAWACLVVGVLPELNERGLSDVYVLDGFIEPLTMDEALSRIVSCYCRNGRILRIGVEKVAAMTFEVHIANALRAKGKHISVESGNLQILTPAGRKKELRIEQNLVWPLTNGKVHVSTGFAAPYRDRLKMEMEKFPYWHDDGIDGLAYTWDIINDYRFTSRKVMDAEESYRWERENRNKYNWMMG